MQTTINKGLVRFSASMAIFCPHCQDVADAKRWVVATIGERTLGTCAPCWDKAIAGKALPASIEVLDGRVLFGRARKAKQSKPAEVTL